MALRHLLRWGVGFSEGSTPTFPVEQPWHCPSQVKSSNTWPSSWTWLLPRCLQVEPHYLLESPLGGLPVTRMVGVRTTLSSQAYNPHPCPGFRQWTSRMYLETHFPQSSGEHIQHSLFILFSERWGWSLIAGFNNILQTSSPALLHGIIKERLLHILPGNEMLAHHSGHIPILVHSEPCSLSSKEGKGSLSSPSWGGKGIARLWIYTPQKADSPFFSVFSLYWLVRVGFAIKFILTWCLSVSTAGGLFQTIATPWT